MHSTTEWKLVNDVFTQREYTVLIQCAKIRPSPMHCQTVEAITLIGYGEYILHQHQAWGNVRSQLPFKICDLLTYLDENRIPTLEYLQIINIKYLKKSYKNVGRGSKYKSFLHSPYHFLHHRWPNRVRPCYEVILAWVGRHKPGQTWSSNDSKFPDFTMIPLPFHKILHIPY